MLKYSADVRSLGFAITLTGLWMFNWLQSQLFWPGVIAACFFAVCVTTMVHNHNHVPIFKNRWLNDLWSYWLTAFYGFPVFAWIPTHNQNHHVYTNRPGDDAPTYGFSEKNTLLTLLAYPAYSGAAQQKTIFRFLGQTWKKDRPRFFFYVSQYVFLAAYLICAFWIDWQKALFYILIPQQIGLNAVLMFNYMQHVHADEQSRYNHSRNILGRVDNFFLFNNGIHTAHHEKPALHWSLLRPEHDRLVEKIDPRLNEPSFLGYVFRAYILGIFSPRLRTDNLRAERMARENATPSDRRAATDRMLQPELGA